jgi:hypothetical protein
VDNKIPNFEGFMAIHREVSVENIHDINNLYNMKLAAEAYGVWGEKSTAKTGLL